MAGYKKAIRTSSYKGKKMFKVFSTFSGIGGFELGIEATQRLVEFVGYSEVDKYAIQVYEHHFKGVKNYGDITKIKAEKLPDFDCLVGGFPCQAFSIAGRRAGFTDTRGTLFFDLARILRAKQPRLFVFENVKGLLSHDNGKTFRVIISAITELGYDCQWQVLNSKHFGVPQNRERIIIVGHLRGTTRPQVFPITENSQADIVLPTLTARYYGAQANGGYIRHKSPEIEQVNNPSHSNDRVYAPGGISPTLNTMQGGRRQPKIIVGSPQYENGKRHVDYQEQDIAPTIRATQHKSGDNQPIVLQDVRGVKKSQNGKGYKEGKDADVAYTVDTLATQGITEGNRLRRLTPLECERLQAFPDNWTLIEGMSDTQRYKMCGNAVTTNVIQAVFERILV